MNKFHIFRFILLAFLVLQAGCAPKNWSPEDDGTYDPFEPINRRVYTFNSDADALALKPLAKFYASLGSEVREPLGNFYNNFTELNNFVNHILQQNGTDAVTSFARFTYNSTLGIGGLFDIATKFGVERRPADFGQTFRAYGFDNSAYFVLLLTGPSSTTDAIGGVFDYSISPACCIRNDTRIAVRAVGGIVQRADLLELGDIVGEIALDEYSFVRDAYEEKRASEAEKRAQALIFKNPLRKSGKSEEADEYVDSNGVWTVTYDATAPQTATDDVLLSTQQ